jgi:hypothetical protein
MPFDIMIGRGGAKKGFFRRSGSSSAGRELLQTDLDAVNHDAPSAVRLEDGSWRVSRPDSGDPWYVASVRAGEIVYSTSYTNHRYVANVVDMFEIAVRTANVLGVQAIEEVRGQRVTSRDLDSLLDRNGNYLRLQVETFQRALAYLADEAHGPLEWPLGPMDLAPDYCVFYVEPDRPVENLAAVMSSTPGIGAFHLAEPRAAVLTVGSLVVRDTRGRVLLRPDGFLQIWPVHGYQPFATCARACFDAAIALHQTVGGRVRLNDHELTPAFLGELQPRLDGYGVDFYTWLSQRANS